MRNYIIVACLLLGFFSCHTTEKKFDKNSYENQKEVLADKEKNSPKEFLKLTGDEHRNFFGKSVYKGSIKNTASVMAYKNIRVKSFYYKAGVLMANHEDEFNETIAPGEDFPFKLKYKTPRGTDSVSAYIMNASAVQKK